MRKLLILALACVMGSVLSLGSAHAQANNGYIFKTNFSNARGGIKDGKMKFIKLATTDSTTVAIGVWGGAITEAAAEDTTDWLDTSNLHFADSPFSEAPVLQFFITHQTGAATDSIGYKLQYTNDPSKAAFSSGSLTHIAANAGGGTYIDVFAAKALSGASYALGGMARWVRVIILNDKIGSGATRLYTVYPVVRSGE